MDIIQIFSSPNERYASNTQQRLNFVLIDVGEVVVVVFVVVVAVCTEREDLGKKSSIVFISVTIQTFLEKEAKVLGERKKERKRECRRKRNIMDR